MPWMPGRSLVDENASDTIESVRLRAAAQNRTHTKKNINALTFHMCSMHKSLWIKLPCYNDADCFALTTHHPGQSIRRTYRYTKMGRLVIMAHHRIWSHFDSHQMLKLKLGPQDNNGIIEIYNNGIYSPCSVVCLRWNVSGMLSFFRPLQSQTQQIGKKKKYHKNCSSKRIAISACQINCVSPPKMAHYFWVRGKRIQCRLQCTNKKIQIHYPSNSVTICSSFSSAPTTLNLRRLHTCGFSYLPNLIFVTIAGWCSFSVINCGGELLFDDHRDAWLLGQSSRILL